MSFRLSRAEARGLDQGRRQPHPVRRGLWQEQRIPQVRRRGDLHHRLEEGRRLLQHHQDPHYPIGKEVIPAELKGILDL